MCIRFNVSVFDKFFLKYITEHVWMFQDNGAVCGCEGMYEGGEISGKTKVKSIVNVWISMDKMDCC